MYAEARGTKQARPAVKRLKREKSDIAGILKKLVDVNRDACPRMGEVIAGLKEEFNGAYSRFMVGSLHDI